MVSFRVKTSAELDALNLFVVCRLFIFPIVLLHIIISMLLMMVFEYAYLVVGGFGYFVSGALVFLKVFIPYVVYAAFLLLHRVIYTQIVAPTSMLIFNVVYC